MNSSVSSNVVFSDNTDLSATDKQNNFGFSIAPSVAISGEGRRIQGRFLYSPRIQFNTSDLESNMLDHFLNTNASIELVKQRYFLDVRATAGINSLFRNAPSGTSDLGSSQNTTQSYTFEIRPYFRQKLGHYANLTGELSHQQVINTDADNNYSNTVSITAESDRRLLKTNLAITATSRRLFNETQPTSKFSSVTATLFHAINRKYTLRGSLGYEDNNFVTDGGTAPAGIIWNVGAEWNINPRLSGFLTYGQRFFGQDVNGRIEYTQRRSRILASVSTGLSTSSALIFQETIFDLLDASGEPIIDPLSGDAIQITQNIPTLSDDVFRNTNFSLRYFATGKRYDVSLSAYFTERTYAVGNADENDFGFSARLSRQLSGSQAIGIGISWDRLVEKAIDRDFNRLELSMTYNHQLGRFMDLNARLVRREGTYSDDSVDSYVEHIVSVGISRNF